MNTITDEIETRVEKSPGALLEAAREKKGYTREYVAGKLHLRVKLIELLETDEYTSMPEPVFIKGYLRAYAKLLEITPDPLLEAFNVLYVQEPKPENKALWQTRKRETNIAEHAVKWLTALFALGALIAVGIWWHNNKGNEHIFSKQISRHEPAAHKSEADIRLTDLSKMRSLLSSNHHYSTLEQDGE